MAPNIFDVQQEVNNNIQRHSHDWRHTNFFSARLGYLYPIFSDIVPANTKLEIEADLGLQFMPMSFPVQTPMKARTSFFKVPLRTLYKDYMDFVGNFKQGLEEPYHDIPDYKFDQFFGECKLGDYLDIPNVVYGGDNGNSVTLKPLGFVSFALSNSSDEFTIPNPTKLLIGADMQSISVPQEFPSMIPLTFGMQYQLDTDVVFQRNLEYTFNFTSFPDNVTASYSGLSIMNTSTTLGFSYKLIFTDQYYNIIDTKLIESDDFNAQVVGVDRLLFRVPKLSYSLSIDNANSNSIKYVFVTYQFDAELVEDDWNNVISSIETANFNYVGGTYTTLRPSIPGQIEPGTYSVVTPETSPYYSSESNPNGEKLLCYRSRAYEAIYNSYYRDPRNNPLLDENGEPVYNKWLLNTNGGADRNVYELHRANWEKDFLTTAVHSPQQGIAPLVGLTQYISETPTENGSNISYNLALVDEDGNKYKVSYKATNDGQINGYSIGIDSVLPETSVAEINYSEMLNATNYGISIPDFRLVNAYQKYLELNIRKGYSYKDIIEGRFDCKVRFDELQMPEFIGGFTRDIQMNRVVQSVDNNVLTQQNTYEGSLGSLSGDAFLSTNGNTPKISVFCDEECVIMGILSIVPQPAYSQLLPKDYLYRSILDHFNPEFNNLGMQPISYAEVCPLQCRAFGVSPKDTFGYQRAWYEYVSKPDKVHGLLRTSLRDFIMNRNFGTVPRLNQSFLLVDDNQLNDVFQVQDEEDKIVGQMYLNIRAELPVNRVQIPRID